MSSCMFLTFSMRWRIECTSSQGVSKVAFFQAKRSHCLGSSCVFGAGSLYFVSSTIIQMVSRGFTSHEFAGWSSFGIKLANPSDTMLAWSVHRLFLFKAFQLFLVTYPRTVVLETMIDNVKLKFFTFLFCGIIKHILKAFSIIFLPQFVKKRPCTPWFVFYGLYFWPLVRSSFRLLQQFDNFFWLHGQKTIKIDTWALAQTV